MPIDQPLGSFESSTSPWFGYRLVSVPGVRRQASSEMYLVVPKKYMPRIRSMSPDRFWRLATRALRRVGIQTTPADAWRYFAD